MPQKLKILGFAGSLRKGSYNKMLLRTTFELLPQAAELEIFDLEGLPFFNEDLEGTPPEKLRTFKEKIRAADGILIATPEYNYSMPGVLKNAIDCASRPYGDNAWDGKPAAIMGASIGMIGTARAQYHLRQSMVFLNMHPVNLPEVMVPFAGQKFDENGRLTDEAARKFLGQLLENLIHWIHKLKDSSLL